MTRQVEQGVRANQEAMTAILRNAAHSIQTHNQQLTAVLSAALAAANKDLTESAGRQPGRTAAVTGSPSERSRL
jgi:DNA-binding protein H-NS